MNKDLTDGCPCLYVIPCNPQCTCINPILSYGCDRCAKYGSTKQRKKKAELLANALEVYKGLCGGHQNCCFCRVEEDNTNKIFRCCQHPKDIPHL